MRPPHGTIDNVKQHFLAKTYQNGFLDPATPAGQTPYVWILTRETGRWKNKSPEKFARIVDLHTLHLPDGSRDDSVETQLSAIETKFSQAMRRDFTRGPLEAQTRADIATFLSALLVRSPRLFREFVPAILGNATVLARFMAEVPGFADALAKKFGDWDATAIADWFVGLSDDAKKAVVFLIILPLVEFEARKLYSRTWIYAVTTHDKPFITSDTPVCFVKLDGTRIPLSTRLIDDPGVIIVAPLSATAALLSPHGNYQLAIQATESLVSDVNQAVLWQSREFVLTCQTGFPGDKELADWLARRPVPDLQRALTLAASISADSLRSG